MCRFVLFAALALSVFAQEASADRIWREFIQWAEAQPARPSSKAYRARLIEGGMTAARADEVVALIGKLYREDPQRRTQLDVLHFNRLYVQSAPSTFTVAPNAFLVRTVKDVKPGKALDIGMGQGRNAVYLATQGWDVTGFDPAEEGLRAAERNAAKAGTRITAVKAGFEDFDYGKERWDLICLIYTDAPQIDPKYVARLQAALKPGGLLLFERPMRSLVDPEPFWPETPLEKKNSMLKAWSDLQIVFYQDAPDISDWQQGPTSRLEKKNRIVRMLARKL